MAVNFSFFHTVRKNRKFRKIRIFPEKITETEFPKTETELETLVLPIHKNLPL